MFGFKKTSELERLRAVYAEQGDGELLRLHEERDGLTDAGRQALADVMAQRGLERSSSPPPPPTSPVPSPAVERGLTSVELAPDEAWLYTFRDTYDLGEATRLLEGAGISLRLVDRSKFKWQGLRSTNEIGIVLIVERWREDEGRAILQEHLQLFPSREADGSPDIALTPASDLTLLLMCDRAHALSLVNALSEAGVSFFWRDGREDKELPDEDTVALEVHGTQHARAEEVVRSWADETASRDDEGEDAEA